MQPSLLIHPKLLFPLQEPPQLTFVHGICPRHPLQSRP